LLLDFLQPRFQFFRLGHRFIILALSAKAGPLQATVMSENQAWQDPAHPIRVEYSPSAIERLRRLAFDGLLSLPRVGLGVGGFLLGTRQRSKLLIADFLAIPCSHSSGPAFDPTASEIESALQLPRPAGLDIVGYYCSRPRRAIEFTPKDQALFFELCPGAHHVFLLIRPSATEDSRAALFYRSAAGEIVGGVEHPLIPLEETESESEVPVRTAKAPEPEVVPPPPPPPPVQSQPQFFGPPPPAPPPSQANPQLFGPPPPLRAPAFATMPQRRKPAWRGAAIVAATLALLFTGWSTREQWFPRPPLELHTAEVDGHFSVEWNRAAVRGIDNGTLTITDGTTSKSIPLNRSQLEAGTLGYTRETTEVAALLIAGDTRASARFVAPPKPVLPVPIPDPEPAVVPPASTATTPAPPPAATPAVPKP